MACPFAKLSINGGDKAAKSEVASPLGFDKKTENNEVAVESKPVVAGQCPFGHGKKSSETSEDRKEETIETENNEVAAEKPVVAGQCPFGYGKKSSESNEDRKEETNEAAVEKPVVAGQCPFGYGKKGSESKEETIEAEAEKPVVAGQCPFGYDKKDGESRGADEDRKEETIEPAAGGKCPLGYDSVSFKIGPFSCVLCRALLYDSSRCVPCRHIYCRACISRFQDCPLCGLDIDSIEPDPDMQGLVDRFVEGHARIRRPTPQSGDQEASPGNVKYEDVSIDRGSFLVTQAMRAFEGKNLESANARLGLCVTDCRDELARSGANATTCSQLGALLGMLGDCCRAMQDIDGAIANYEESVEVLMKLSDRDAEVVHASSVSLNKLGDLKYYAQDLESARAFYARALNVRLEATSDFTTLSPQIIDVAVSLAKVADVDFALGKESAATEGFQDALKKLEGLSPSKTGDNAALEKKRLSVMGFLQSQLTAAT